MTATAAAATAAGARSNLIAVAITPVPIGLVRMSASPARAPALDQTRVGIDFAGDRVAELDFLVLHGVAAEERDPRLVERLQTAAKDLFQHGRIARPWETPAIASAVSGVPPIA